MPPKKSKNPFDSEYSYTKAAKRFFKPIYQNPIFQLSVVSIVGIAVMRHFQSFMIINSATQDSNNAAQNTITKQANFSVVMNAEKNNPSAGTITLLTGTLTTTTGVENTIGNLYNSIGSFCFSVLGYLMPNEKNIKSILTKIDQVLPEPIKNNPNLYSPILSTIIAGTISGVSTLSIESMRYFSMQRSHQQENFRLIENNEITELARSGQQSLMQGDPFSALSSLRIARKKFEALYDITVNEAMLTKWNDIAINEARSLYFLGKFDNETEKYALQILDKILRKNLYFIDALNLRGCLLLHNHFINEFKQEEDNSSKIQEAIKNFETSLDANPAQSETFTLWAFSKSSFIDTLTYIENIDYETLWSNNLLHIILMCQGKAFWSLKKENDIGSIINSIERYEAAEMTICKNPAFNAMRCAILKELLTAYSELVRKIKTNQTITIKTLFPHLNKRKTNTQEEQVFYLQQQSMIANIVYYQAQLKKENNTTLDSSINETISTISSYAKRKLPAIEKVFNTEQLTNRESEIDDLLKKLKNIPDSYADKDEVQSTWRRLLPF
jgi:hypothetical protein